jgi:hypothetical protein
MTATCLGRAEEALAATDGQTPDYAAWIDENELAIMTGRCWSELHRPLRAVPVLERALGSYSDAHARDKAPTPPGSPIRISMRARSSRPLTPSGQASPSWATSPRYAPDNGSRPSLGASSRKASYRPLPTF